jgi:hypothetical protein
MIWLLALFAAFGLWRVTAVLRRGGADGMTGAILVVLGPMMALPLVVLGSVWQGGRVPLEQAMVAGGLGLVCVMAGVALLLGRRTAG